MRSTPGQRGTFTEDARRAQIVDCAIEVIAELGYGATSIRKIADRVGVAMSVVLYHFGNKDDLVAAVVERGYRTLLEVMVPAVDAEDGPVAKVHAFIRTYVDYMATNRTLLLAVSEIGSNFRSREGLRLDQLPLDADIQAQLAKVELDTLVAALARRGKLAGVPVKSVAIALRGAVDASVAQLMRDPEFDTASYGQHVAELFDRLMGDGR
jgi:AcrR family transcriptional regulator